MVAYLLPALAALVLAWRARHAAALVVVTSTVLGFILGVLWVVLEIRHLFQGEQISVWRSTSDAEFYTYSAVFLAIGLVLLAYGIVRGSRLARLVSAAYILLAVVKAFLFDMPGLTGAYRALSFIGLGIVLVGIGLVYQKWVFRGRRRRARRPRNRPRPPEATAPQALPPLVLTQAGRLSAIQREAMRLGDGRAGHLAVGTLRPSRRYLSSASACSSPCRQAPA